VGDEELTVTASLKGVVTAEEVESLHAEYVECLKRLYDENKGKYGDPKVELVIN